MTNDEELRRIQNLAVQNAIQEMDAAAALGLDTKEGRGDRGWLTGMAGKSLAVAVKIEQFVALRAGRKTTPDEEEDEEASKGRLVKEASAEVAEIMKRVRGAA